MSVRVLALESNVTTLEDHRLELTLFQYPSGALTGESGVRPGGAALSSDTAMVATISPFTAWIQGSGSTQGGYAFVSDDEEDITFDAGEAGNARIDRIIARVYDDVYDASGFTMGSVEYLKGQSGGAANSVPSNAILLYEISVPAGASAGGTPINFANAVDKRTFTAANGGILPVGSATDRDALTNLYDGKVIWRYDRDWLECHDGSNWKVISPPIVSTIGNASLITSPRTGQLLTVSGDGSVYIRYDNAWKQLLQGPDAPRIGEVIFRARSTASFTFSDGSPETIPFSSEEWDTYGIHSTSSNTSRLKPVYPGKYRFTGGVAFQSNPTGSREAMFYLNGSPIAGSSGRVQAPSISTAGATVARPTTVQMNGTTDYVELVGAAYGASPTHFTTTHAINTSVEVQYVGP